MSIKFIVRNTFFLKMEGVIMCVDLTLPELYALSCSLFLKSMVLSQSSLLLR